MAADGGALGGVEADVEDGLAVCGGAFEGSAGSGVWVAELTLVYTAQG